LGVDALHGEPDRVLERDGESLPGQGVDVGADAGIRRPQRLAVLRAVDELLGVTQHASALPAEDGAVRRPGRARPARLFEWCVRCIAPSREFQRFNGLYTRFTMMSDIADVGADVLAYSLRRIVVPASPPRDKKS
jgi:hypothetical protein